MSFNVGDKVICIDDDWPLNVHGLYREFPIKGNAYTIRDVRIGINLAHQGDVSILLDGLVNPRSNSRPYLERGFKASRFHLVKDEVVA